MAEAELALRRERSESDYRESLQAVLANAQQIERIVETLVCRGAARRAAAGRRERAVDVAEAVVAAYSHDASSRGVDLELDRHARARCASASIRTSPSASCIPVVENALRYGRGAVQVRVTRNGSTVLFAVDDDGPGVQRGRARDDLRARRARQRGPLEPTTAPASGSRSSRRLARAVSGDVEAFPGASGHFVVRLPPRALSERRARPTSSARSRRRSAAPTTRRARR